MTIKQISVFVENEAGQLSKFVDVLSKHDVDMRALSIAETKDFGIVRVIVDDSYKASTVLKEAGYIFSLTPVLAAAVPDEPGALKHILDILGENEINLEYTYAFITRNKDLAYMILRVEDNDKAIEVLSKGGIQLLSQEDLERL
ncbi:MAG: acetolactate synthase [Eubacterium sp.]|nr:acetolactate synthase [Eubacterium sp.]